MQTNNEYRELMDEARKKHLANIQAVSREIAKLYREAAKDLAKRARKHRKGTLPERWATEYTYQLSKRSKELYSGLYEVTLQGLKRSASYPAIAAGDFFSIVGGQSFAGALANTPDLVMAEILSGEIYKDKRGLSARIWGTTKGLENDVDYIVNRAIAEHKSAVNLAADLEEYVQEPAKRSWDWGKVYPNLRGKRVDYNAQRLARTSINHSYWLSNVKTCERNPFVTAMHWELSMSHEARQVIPFGRDCCDDYAEHDEGLGVGNFPVSSLPLPHPQCLCVQWAVIPESLEDIGDEIGRWMAGEPNARLDTWYQKEYSEELKRSEKGGIIQTGGRITDLFSEEADKFAEMYYEEIRHFTTDTKKIADTLGKSEADVLRVKSYLFIDKSLYDDDIGEFVRFPPDCAIAHSWQRLFIGKDIKPHDITLINHELLEMQIKDENPDISHYKAHEIATEKYNYQKEADEYYAGLEESSNKKRSD